MSTVIIVPTYNERDNIAELIPAIFSAAPDAAILVVDDNSPDGTGELVATMQKSEPRLRLLKRERKEGLGRAYLHAFKEILKDDAVDTIVTMDADFSHDPASIPSLRAARSRADVVIGSRYVAGGGTEGWEFWRRMLSWGGNLYSRLVTQMPVRDLTAGFLAINTRYLRAIDRAAMDNSGYAFLMELKFLLRRAGATFAEVPIVFRRRRGGESKISGHIVSEGILAPWKMALKR